MTGLPIGRCCSLASILIVLSVHIYDVESYAFTTQQKSTMFTLEPRNKFPCVITTSCGGYCEKANIFMKVSKGKSKHSKNNSLHTINKERKKLAGRRGTKNFVDPNKVFVGNLPYDADEDEVYSWLVDHLGGKVGKHNIESFKLIRDWKTGKSKGFGFVNFMDPIYATSAMAFLKGKKLRGRFVNLHQGKRKEQDKLLIVQKRDKNKAKQDEESQVIDAALDSAENLAYGEYEVGDFNDIDDSSLFDDEDDDDDFEYDGIFEETSKYEPLTEEEQQNLNREQRRDKSRRKKRKKLPRNGFGE